MPALRRAPEPRVVLRPEALELLHPDAAGTRRRRRELEALYIGSNYAIGPVVEAILKHPDLYTGRDGQAARRLHRRHAARARPRRSTRRLGLARLDRPASSSSTRRTSPAGTTAAGSTRRRFRGRWYVAREALDRTDASTRTKKVKPTQPTRRRSSTARSRSGARRRSRTGRETCCSTFAQRALADADRGLAAEDLSVLIYNALRQLIADRAGGPDVLNDDAAPAATTSRARSSSAARPPRRAAGCPSIEPGMPLPAGTGMSRQSLLLALGRAGARGLRARPASPRRCSRRESRAQPRAPADPILVSIFLEGGADALSALYPADDPVYQSLRPNLKLAAGAGQVFSENTKLPLASRALAAGHAARPGQGRGPARGRLHERRPVPLHLAPLLGGGRHRPLAPDRLARALPGRRRHAGQPAPGPCPRRPAEPVARDRVGPGRGDRRARALRPRRQPRVGRRSRTTCSRRSTTSASRRPGRRGPCGRRQGRRAGPSPARAAAAVQRHRRDPGAYPDGTFATQLSSLSKLIAAGLPLRCVVAQRAGQLRHTRGSGRRRSPTG